MSLRHQYYPLPWDALSYDIELAGFRTKVREADLRDARSSTMTSAAAGNGSVDFMITIPATTGGHRRVDVGLQTKAAAAARQR